MLVTFRMDGSGNGHWIGWSLSKGSTGCSTGLNSVATSIPWVAVVAVMVVAAVTSEFGANTSLSSWFKEREGETETIFKNPIHTVEKGQSFKA